MQKNGTNLTGVMPEAGDRARRAARHRLRGTTLLLALSLSACASAYDPKPWVPNDARKAIVYKTPSEAGLRLDGLAKAYQDKAGGSAREAMAMDIPLIGLAFAGPINAAFGGAKDVTIALGFGSTGFTLGRAYFNPHLKVSAYDGAGTALTCAWCSRVTATSWASSPARSSRGSR